MWFSLQLVTLGFLLSQGFCRRAVGNSFQLVPHSNPISIPIRAQDHRKWDRRAVGDNATTVAGISSVTRSSDRQSYFALITVGNISFRIALDTASSDLWLTSTNCETTTCKSVPRYPLTYQSPTFMSVDNNETSFSAQYADGTFASGFVARETVQLANCTVPNQVFGMVTDSNVTMVDQTSGILGLGFPRLSSIPRTVTNSTPFFANLAQLGVLDYPLFALSLTSNSSGTLTLGAVDASIVSNSSQISWNKVAQFQPFGAESNVSSYLQWAIPLSAIYVNSSAVSPAPTYPSVMGNNSLALFDVGSPGIYGPYQDVLRIYSLIDGARLVNDDGQWAIPCTTSVSLTFTFGHQNYTLLPSDYIIGVASGNPNLCLSWPQALPPSADGIDWQIGATFLRTVYSIYSFGINSKEPPMIGLYSLQNFTNTSAITEFVPALVSSLFDHVTVPTTLPNFPLPTPTFSIPPYGLNTSVGASIGRVVSTGLATSTYSPLVGTRPASFNASALPTISPIPSLVTFILTDMAGNKTTSVLTHTAVAVTLGVPPGRNEAETLRVGTVKHFLLTIGLCTLLVFTDFI